MFRQTFVEKVRAPPILLPKVHQDELAQKALIRKDYILYSYWLLIYSGYLTLK